MLLIGHIGTLTTLIAKKKKKKDSPRRNSDSQNDIPRINPLD